VKKIAVVVQRYGADINGGAELHARYVAERLARHVTVEVLTTCARDYVTWRNDLTPGQETVNGLTVRRFPVTRERDPDDFGRWSRRVFDHPHSVRDELGWLDAEGPTSPALIEYLRQHERDYDFFIFFSVRYYHAYHGVRAVGRKAILVPTAERDGALGLGIFPPILRGVGAIMYNSFEERALIQAVANNHDVPSVVVGVGSEIPARVDPAGFRARFRIDGRFAIYVGRIDANKGCAELFDYFKRYVQQSGDELHLVLIGNPIIPIPEHPYIHHLGFVSDQDKFDALAAAELLIMPSYLESLSMVALEAWALGVPVLVNAKCDVLKGQCLRSNGGLYYENFSEFVGTMRALSESRTLAAALGSNGREYFRRHYTWPIVERKYLDMIERLSSDTPAKLIEPLPGWFARWRKSVPAAETIVAALPIGPALAVNDPASDRAAQPRPQPRPAAQASRPPAPQQPSRPPSSQPSKSAARDASRPATANASDRRGDPARRRSRGRGGHPGDRRSRPPRRSNGH
jgi:glycosyltransferase involved in cell wall biosynthesis